jgi:hypothetical protein
MSHFTVLVVGEDAEKQLAPFCEDTEHLPKKDLEFEGGDNYVKEFEEDSRKVIALADGSLVGMYDDMFRNPNYSLGSEENRYIYPDDSEEVEVTFKEFYGTMELFMSEWHGMEEPDKTTGKYGYWVNPKAKWDWYQLGGRWRGMLKLKEGATGATGASGGLHNAQAKEGWCDSAMIKDIDFDGIAEEYRIGAEKSWAEYLQKKKEEPENKILEYLYSVRENDTKETYINRQTNFSTFAILKDKVWYEKGEMGWWAVVHDEKDDKDWDSEFRNLLDSLEPDTLISVYDCHI